MEKPASFVEVEREDRHDDTGAAADAIPLPRTDSHEIARESTVEDAQTDQEIGASNKPGSKLSRAFLLALFPAPGLWTGTGEEMVKKLEYRRSKLPDDFGNFIKKIVCVCWLGKIFWHRTAWFKWGIYATLSGFTLLCFGGILITLLSPLHPELMQRIAGHQWQCLIGIMALGYLRQKLWRRFQNLRQKRKRAGATRRKSPSAAAPAPAR
jgi:hypothetical protein